MRNKKNKLLLIVILGLFCIAANNKPVWLERKSEHFIVYFTQDEKFAQQVLDSAEKYYHNIASNLGYARYSEFWTWEKRVKIYIYPDRASFQEVSRQPEWSEGMADYKKKEIVSYAWSHGFLESLLPHEMTHLIFRDFVGFLGEVPLWLDEGVAQWEEEAKRPQIKKVAKDYFDKDNLMSINDIMKLNILNLKSQNGLFIRPTRTKEGKPGVIFLSSNNLVEIYYLQSASLVGYLIERFGSESFSAFCRELRDGKGVEEALSIAYPARISNLRDLEDGWREYLQESS
jgi:hypothetical protein